MKMTAVRDLWMVPVSLRSAWDIRRACPPTCDSPIAPSSSVWGIRAATESMTTRSTAPERTSMSAISRGLLAVVGLRDEQFVGFDAKAPGIGHVKRVFGVDEGAAVPPSFWHSAMTCRVRVVLPEDSGP